MSSLDGEPIGGEFASNMTKQRLGLEADTPTSTLVSELARANPAGDSVYLARKCYEAAQRIASLEAEVAEAQAAADSEAQGHQQWRTEAAKLRAAADWFRSWHGCPLPQPQKATMPGAIEHNDKYWNPYKAALDKHRAALATEGDGDGS